MNRVTLSAGENQANMILFDIQSDQKDSLAQLARNFKLPVMNQVPIITLRIEEINGRNASDLAKADSLADAGSGGSREPSQRAFRGELRVTFQDTLTEAEKIVKGSWSGKVKEGNDVFVSLEENYARRIHVDVGDTIVWNVQGMLLPTIVGSFRSVNWSRMQTNFRVVFPQGVLEEAPQFFVMMTRVPEGQVSADFQTAVVRGFPNVSVIDLKLILQVLDELLSKIGFVIRFMAGLCMLTGWIVLISTILTSRGQRLRESALLRMLGAGRKQILVITALEYLFISVLAVGAGLILALSGSYALARYSFDAVFVPPLWPIAGIFVVLSLLVVLTGLFGNRSVLNHPPIEALNA